MTESGTLPIRGGGRSPPDTTVTQIAGKPIHLIDFGDDGMAVARGPAGLSRSSSSAGSCSSHSSLPPPPTTVPTAAAAAAAAATAAAAHFTPLQVPSDDMLLDLGAAGGAADTSRSPLAHWPSSTAASPVQHQTPTSSTSSPRDSARQTPGDVGQFAGPEARQSSGSAGKSPDHVEDDDDDDDDDELELKFASGDYKSTNV